MLSGKFFDDQPIITACGGSDRMEWNDLLLVYSIHRFFYTCVDGSSSLLIMLVKLFVVCHWSLWQHLSGKRNQYKTSMFQSFQKIFLENYQE